MPAGSLAKASLVGAKTVNGPGPLRVSTRPAALTAATKRGVVLRVPPRSRMMFLVGVHLGRTADHRVLAHLGGGGRRRWKPTRNSEERCCE